MEPLNADERSDPFIRICGVSKTFAGVDALRDVSFDIRPGVVHGLVGANGAGKSTLVRCLAGIHQPDSGTIEVEGQPVVIATPQSASDHGLSFIHQEMSLIPGWNVLRNMALGSPPATRLGVIDWRPTRARALEVAQVLEMNFDLATPVDGLSVAHKWLVLIGRALMRDARMVAMDEPTASLSAKEADRLHGVIRTLASRGTAVLFVSHRLDEVSQLCTDITVLKDGRVTERVVGGNVSKAQLIRAIVGRELVIPDHGHAPKPHGPRMLEVSNVADGKLVKDVSFVVHAGEVVGLGGLVGAGRSELVKIVFGAARASSGNVLLDGEPVAFRHPAEAIAAQVGLVPEERRAEGLFVDRTIDFNINIAKLDSLRRSLLWPFLRMGEARTRAQKAADLVTVKAKDVTMLVAQLSGGNQQKVVIARWLLDQPRLLILDEPSRGVDVGARAELYEVIRKLTDRGTAVLVVSSDNDELVTLCDRVVVMVEGRVSGTLTGESITTDHIVHLSFAHERERLPTL